MGGYGNIIIVNCTAINVGASTGTVNNLNISYNHILTNGVFINLTMGLVQVLILLGSIILLLQFGLKACGVLFNVFKVH